MKYKVIENMGFAEGILELDDDQAKTRAHNLEKLEDGCHRVVNPIRFKAGEIIGYSGKLDKYLDRVLESLEKEETPEAPKELTKAEIIAKLVELGIEHDSRVRKDVLMALLEEAEEAIVEEAEETSEEETTE